VTVERKPKPKVKDAKPETKPEKSAGGKGPDGGKDAKTAEHNPAAEKAKETA